MVIDLDSADYNVSDLVGEQVTFKIAAYLDDLVCNMHSIDDLNDAAQEHFDNFFVTGDDYPMLTELSFLPTNNLIESDPALIEIQVTATLE